MVSVWIRASRLRYAGRSQAIPLRNQRRLGRRVKGQLHRLGHAPNLVPNLVGEPLDDPPQLLGVRLLETGRVDGKPGEPAGDLRDHSRCESGRKEHQQDVGRIQVISQLSRTLSASHVLDHLGEIRILLGRVAARIGQAVPGQEPSEGPLLDVQSQERSDSIGKLELRPAPASTALTEPTCHARCAKMPT